MSNSDTDFVDGARRILLALAGLVLAGGAVYWYTHDTPANRAATEMAYYNNENEKEKTKREEERTKQMRIQARLQQQVVSSPPLPQHTTCDLIAGGQTMHQSPKEMVSGSCIQMTSGRAYLWARFNGVPTRVEGVRNVYTVRVVGTMQDGSPDLGVAEQASGSAIPDFIRNHQGEPIYIRQAENQQLFINM